jgi:hypothetical protein
MIVYNPPQALPFIPAAQKLARVALDVFRSESAGPTKAPHLQFVMFDENGDRISPYVKAMPNGGKITPADATSIMQAKAAQAGDTVDQAQSRAALPFVEAALGIKGGTVA